MTRLGYTVQSVAWLILALLGQAHGDAAANSLDPKIASALRQISAQRVESDIRQLVSFHTRVSISAQDADAIAAHHGIGAAREWIKSEFEHSRGLAAAAWR